MTARKKQKRLAHARQARTGETYMQALQHVRAQVAQTNHIDVVELVSLTEVATRIGLRCEIGVFPALLTQVEPEPLVLALRDTLVAADGDRPLRAMRRAAFLGELPALPETPSLVEEKEDAELTERALAGVRGQPNDERGLAFQAPGRSGQGSVTALALLSPGPHRGAVPPAKPTPRILLSPFDGRLFTLPEIAKHLVRR